MEAHADRLRTSAAKTKGEAHECWAGVTATLQKRRAEPRLSTSSTKQSAPPKAHRGRLRPPCEPSLMASRANTIHT